ncbi:hypothetical protein GF348_02935 [candidate division KSB3 bacterium]|nr:hypothetical protein [candidate division KSB3 bacterium]
MTNTPNKPPRVAVWSAVSSKPQAQEHKDSLQSQLRDGRAWAKEQGGDVVATYQIPGHTRSYIFLETAAEEMDAYRQLMDDCAEQRWDVLWCRGRDRLGRTDALIAQVEAVVREIGGAQIYSAAIGLPLDASTTATLYASGIERAQAQEEIERIRRRHRRGMRHRVKELGLHCGKLPYGYRTVRNEAGQSIGAEIDPDEIGAIHLVTEAFLRGEGYRAISNKLNASAWEPKQADLWDHTQVRTIVRCDTYAGYVSYGDIHRKSDQIPAIWDNATWQQIQAETKRRYRGRQEPATPVTGSIVCAKCGYNMLAGKSHGRRIYRCGRHKHRGDCHNNATRYSRIEEALLNFLRALDNPEAIVNAIHQNQPNAQQIAQELESTMKNLEALRKQRTRLALDRAKGDMDIDVYRAADNELLDRLDAAEELADELRIQMNEAPNLDQQIESVRTISELTKENPEWLNTIPVREGQTLLQNAGIVIRCQDTNVVSISIG